MINLKITQEIKKEYLKTIFLSLLQRKYFKLFKLNRKGNDISENKLFSFYKELVKAKNLKLNNKRIKLKDILFADYKTIKLIIDTNKSINFTNEEKDKANSIYKYFRSKWAYALVEKLDISSCPYCNRNFIVNFNKNETTVQLDHFFDKSTYPYLAISLYNLIPSCSTCNQRKSSSKKEILYPYEDDFNKKAKFTHFFNNKNEENNQYSIFSKERISLDLNPINKDDLKTENTIETLRLKELYNEHKDIVVELIQKAEMYNDSYIDELMTNYEGTIFKNREDLMRLITCGYINDEDINKRPLSKLIKDISEELGLI